ncbi:MAG TPA: DUF6544 family protein [Allosphingosinicella sp.]|jgi:hypothetical protein
MKPLTALALSAPLLVGGASALAWARRRGAMRSAEEAWRAVASRAEPAAGLFDPACLGGLPEIARRYFLRAIAPGTPLATTVELEMAGTFLLGDARRHRRFGMTARQILRPPFEFVWMPRLAAGAMRIDGSDALVAGEAWTRFFLAGLVPVADVRSSPDLVRSAVFRSAVEGIWAPASLLPERGVAWEQIGADRARVTLSRTEPEIAIELALNEDGTLREVAGARWSNANGERRFRLQPFGGTVLRSARFAGFTIPAEVHVGNHFGTADYLPFFQARIVDAVYR